MLELPLAVIFLFFVSFFPGRSVVERLQFTRLEKFCAGFGVSFFIFFVAGFLGFIFNLPPLPFHQIIVASSLLYSAWTLLRFRWLGKEELVWLGILFTAYVFIISIQGLLPNYIGGSWIYDWYEHYARMQYFLLRLPIHTHFGPYLLPARPPLFNVVAFFWQSMVGAQFWRYQLAASMMNLTLILTGWLFVAKFLKRQINLKFLLFATAVFLLNPAVVVELTFTWSKALAVYYLLTGFYFYLKFRDGNPRHIFLAAVFLGAAYLTHYLAVPYILGIIIDGIRQSILDISKVRARIIGLLIFISIAYAQDFLSLTL
ncbi:MAG: hypothetical protein AAB874_04135, partial [Patescibacteria group bacterium]